MSWEISSSGTLVAAVDVLASEEALLAALPCAESFCCSRRVFASFCSMRRRSSSAGAIGVAALLVDGSPLPVLGFHTGYSAVSFSRNDQTVTVTLTKILN